MEIIRRKEYLDALYKTLEYIARDSLTASKKLLKSFDKKINKLDYMPYKFRESYYYDNENIRDLIVFGYTIPYLIDTEKNQIAILDIFKWEER